jgi:hypothetical protein
MGISISERIKLAFNALFKGEIKEVDKRVRRDDKKNDKTPLEHIYTDKFGNKYFQLMSIEQMSQQRAYYTEIAAIKAEMCVTKETLLIALREMRELGNKGEIVKMFGILDELEQRVEYGAEEETLMLLASVFFFDEYEDINDYVLGEQMRKMEIWKQDERAKNFFLLKAFHQTKNSINISEQDIARYLRVGKEKQILINALLARQSETS